VTRAWHGGLLGGAVALAAALGSFACVDAVHEDAVQALGGESPGVSPGPLHRPGQPCVTCHGGSGPAKTQFSMAGTVYAVDQSNQPAAGAIVSLEDVDGLPYNTTTNSVGNFFLTLSDFFPHYPVSVMNVASSDGSQNQGMTTLINRDGSCADCHANPRGPDSEGPIYLQAAGGMP
jgi:hypothetical protein